MLLALEKPLNSGPPNSKLTPKPLNDACLKLISEINSMRPWVCLHELLGVVYLGEDERARGPNHMAQYDVFVPSNHRFVPRK